MNKTKTLKKLLSVALVLMMVLSTMVIMPLTANALEGDGSSETPYKVASLDDLKAVKKVAAESFIGKELYMVLTADIEMSGSFDLTGGSYPNATNACAVKWQIDGQGHTISNTNTQLLYGVYHGVTVKNLNVVMNQTNGEGYGAGIIGVVYGGTEPTLIENCTVSGKMTYTRTSGTPPVPQDRYAGAVLGAIASTTANVTVRNCVNNATVVSGNTAKHSMGGMVGEMSGTGTLTIENCVNNGTIEVQGGAVGGMLGKYVNGTVSIDNCINNGKLVNTNTLVGGMVGYQPKTAAVTVTNCYSTGEADVPVSGGSNAPVITNNKTLDEVRAMITMPRQDGSTLAELATAEKVWDGSTTTAPKLASLLDEDPENDAATNSAENPYLIGTAAELAYLSTTVLSYVKLTDNIDMGGHKFGGLKNGSFTFDGDNYTVYNASVQQYSAGFVCSGSGTVVLKNLHLSALRSAGGSGSAAIMAYCNGFLTCTNVTVDANSIVALERGSGSALAGFVGDEYGSSSAKLAIDRCIMGAVIGTSSSGTTNAGAIVGGYEKATNVTVSNTIVECTMVTADTTSTTIGALVGAAGAAYAFDNVYMLAGLTAGGCTGGYDKVATYTPTLSNNYSASFAASENFAEEIAEINKMGLTDVAVSSTVAGKRATRLKVTDDFGFMAMADAPVGIYNPHATYGIVVLKGTADAATLMADGEFVAAENYVGANGVVCAAYTDITVATMDETYTYAFAVAANGVVAAIGTIYTINCYDWATQLAVDGTYEGTAVTNVETEIALYGAMVNYCDKYNLYLAYVNENQ